MGKFYLESNTDNFCLKYAMIFASESMDYQRMYQFIAINISELHVSSSLACRAPIIMFSLLPQGKIQ